MDDDESPHDFQDDINRKEENQMTHWHWIIIIGTSFGTALVGLLPHSFGTLIAYFKSPLNSSFNSSLFEASQFQLNWLPALSSAAPGILLPFFAIIVNMFNGSYQLISGIAFLFLSIGCGLSSLVTSWSLLFFTYSLLYSIGSSIYLAVTIIIIAEYFPTQHKYHVLATSLYQIGYPTAALIGNPILAALLTNYGWQISFKCLSFFIISCGLGLACLMKPLINQIFRKRSDSKSYGDDSKFYPLSGNPRIFSNISLDFFVSTYEIWPWLIGKCLNYMCWYGLRTNVVTYLVKSTTFGLTKSAFLMSLYAGAEISVGLLCSLGGDSFRGFLIYIHIISAVSLTVFTGIFPVAITSYLSAVLLMVSVGILVQLSLSFGYPTSAEILNSKYEMKIGWILTNVAAGVGILISPFFSGIMMDSYGIRSLFYAQSSGWILQGIFFAITAMIVESRKRKHRSEYQEIRPDSQYLFN